MEVALRCLATILIPQVSLQPLAKLPTSPSTTKLGQSPTELSTQLPVKLVTTLVVKFPCLLNVPELMKQLDGSQLLRVRIVVPQVLFGLFVALVQPSLQQTLPPKQVLAHKEKPLTKLE